MAALDFPNSPTNGDTFTSPNSGAIYTWDGSKWLTSSVAATTAAQNNVGRNLIHNPLFNIAQRGAGPFTTTAVYTLDRWIMYTVLDTDSITKAAASDADRAQIGDEAVFVVLQNTFTGNAGATAQSFIQQNIEGARRLSGKTVTVSFYANASATLKLGVNLLQSFGSGGSPSAPVTVQATGAAVTAGAAWARYSATFAIPSTAGKVFGTNGDDSTLLRFYYSSGATGNAAAGNIGVQSGTIGLWGVQLEVGSVATPLEKPDPQQDLAKCQRFYITSAQQIQIGFNAWAASAFEFIPVFYPVPMRSIPIVVLGTLSGTGNFSSGSVTSGCPFGFNVQGVATAAGGTNATYAGFTASADL